MLKIVNQNDLSGFSGSCSHLFISPEWLKVISDTYGFEFYAIVSEEKDFIFPFCVLKDDFYTSVKSIPFGDYTLNNCPEKLLNESLQILKNRYPGHYIETSVVSNSLSGVKSFNVKKYGYLIRIDIKKWKEDRGWKEAYERNILNALNYGLTVRVNKTLTGLHDFYKLHEQLRIIKFRKLPQPFRFFENIYHEFIIKDKGFLLEAWDKNNLVASWVILEHAKVLYYKFGSSDVNSLRLRPNDLLFRSLMQYGSDMGFNTIDLGFSGASKSYEGLIRFKSKEGGVKTPIYRIERYPESFDFKILREKKKYLNNFTQKALASNDYSIIEKVSKEHYGEFG